MRNAHAIEAISLDHLSNVNGGCGHCHHHCGGCCGGGGGGGTTIINNNNAAPSYRPAPQASAGFDVQVATGGASIA
ncbi:MAG: hypothetical protein ACM31C_16275 [Acidobacteriota bacterium]